MSKGVKNMSKIYYVGSDVSDDQLMHWKYIKREKVNGKWRYYYDTGKKEKIAAGNAKSKVRDAAQNASFHKKRYDEVKSKVDSGEFFDKDHGNDSIVEPYRNAYLKSLQGYENAKVQAKKAQQIYAKTPLSKIENAKAKVDAGKKSAAKFLEDAKEAVVDKINSAYSKTVIGKIDITVDKGKKWLKDLLKIR